MTEYRSVIIVLIVASSAIVTSTDNFVEMSVRCSESEVDAAIYLKHEYDCAKFYKCAQGKRIPMICPYKNNDGSRLHFNPGKQICDWPDSKVCDDKWRGPKICPPNLRQCIRIAHEKDCDKFYLCDHGREMIVECAKGLHFNPATQMCDYPKSAGCSDSCGWTCCPPKGSPVKVRLPHECSCAKYYECLDEDRILRKCPSGMHFDDRRKRCVPAEEAGCVIKMETPPTDAATRCPKDDVGRPVNLPHQRECDLYYECSKGEMILRKCQANTSFNPQLGRCDLPENIQCNVSACCGINEGFPVPSDEDDIVPEEPKCPAEGTAKLPHPEKCSLYYVCDNGSKTVHECPSGLHFNPVTDQCDWPFNVKCTARQRYALHFSKSSFVSEDEGNVEDSKAIFKSRAANAEI